MPGVLSVAYKKFHCWQNLLRNSYAEMAELFLDAPLPTIVASLLTQQPGEQLFNQLLLRLSTTSSSITQQQALATQQLLS